MLSHFVFVLLQELQIDQVEINGGYETQYTSKYFHLEKPQ